MKEKIYTIPVNEAFDQNGECPLCALHKKLESDTLNYMLGSSYMEEDVRAETDKYGFCKDHYLRMFQAGNRLGLALMLHTHLKKINKDLDKLLDEELKGSGQKKGLFKKDTDGSALCDFITETSETCYACSRMESTMKSYMDTILFLWKTEPDFRKRVADSKGFCLEHLRDILEKGKKKLSANDYKALVETVVPIQKDNFKRVEDEIDWFIKKFDYRFQDEPWKNSKDAVERAILKIASTSTDEVEKIR